MRWLLLYVLLSSPAYASTVPQFTRGTMTSRTESSTTVTENIVIENYSTGTSYTMSGHNIQWQGVPGPGTTYTQLTPGLATRTTLTRVTDIQSTTTSMSVFTQ